MEDKRALLRHFLAALAYRTQKALHDAPKDFGSFHAGKKIRTPHELVSHMDSVIGYACTFYAGGMYQAPEFPDFNDAIKHFHQKLVDLSHHLEIGTEMEGMTAERLLQGPLSDAMTHAGQLALLRRLAGSPVPPENFVYADIRVDNPGPEQPQPVRPDKDWPEAPDNDKSKA